MAAAAAEVPRKLRRSDRAVSDDLDMVELQRVEDGFSRVRVQVPGNETSPFVMLPQNHERSVSGEPVFIDWICGVTSLF